MPEHNFEDYILSARKLYKAAQYNNCIEYIDIHIQKLAENRPLLGIAHCLQAQSHYRLENFDKAMISALRALEVNPKNEDAYYWLGNIYRELGFYQMAESAYKRAISLYPNEEFYYLNLASVNKMQNKLNDAIYHYGKMLEINPKSTKAYRNMSVCFKYDSIHHEHHAKIMDLLCEPNITDEEKMECYFTLGKIYQDCNQFHQAFYFLQAANALRAVMVPFSSSRYSKKIDDIINNFDLGKIKSPTFGEDGEHLVFVIGIPRSGKSLIERLLVSSDQAAGLGEVAVFERIIKKVSKSLKIKSFYGEDPLALDRELIQLMAQEYLADTKRRSFAQAKIIVDTTPTNYQHLGLIARLFPKAKIIYCTRHPLDHILQIYFKYFAEGNGFSYDLVKLTHFYLDYNRLMSFWKDNAILQMIEVNYEELVKHPQDASQRICEFVGITPSDKRDDFHRHEVGLWKNYDNYLEVVKAIFKKHEFPFNS
jgi:hypothetical protein